MKTKDTMLKATVRVRTLLLGACILSGCLAGVNIENYLVRVPAWRKVDILSWAQYSKEAYFGNGFLLYQLEAAGSFVCLLWASVIIYRNRFKFLAPQVYFGLLASFAGMALTFMTAPIMFGLHKLGTNPALLRAAFDEVHYWGAFRGLAHVISFCACAWAMGRAYVIQYVRP